MNRDRSRAEAPAAAQELPFQHRARKRFGQNFLHDAQVIDRIVRAIRPAPGQTVIEIGPGQGALTTPLLTACGALTVIEIDRDLAGQLRQRHAGEPAFTLVEGDVLDQDFAAMAAGLGNLRIVGNLPYNISTPLLFHLLKQRAFIHDMVFMLQREVVERLAAAPDSEAYGRLSVMMQYHCAVEPLFNVPPGAFTPAPKVDSAVVRLTPHRPSPFPPVDEGLFGKLVKAAFSQRRKTLRNTLKPLFPAPRLEQLPVDLQQRAETLGVSDYVRLAGILEQCGPVE